MYYIIDIFVAQQRTIKIFLKAEDSTKKTLVFFF